MDAHGKHLLATVEAGDVGDTVPEEDPFTNMVAFDDVSGEELDPKAVAAARQEEIAYFRSMNVYKKVSLDECRARTGNGPIQCRWIDINKGDRKNPKYRSRLVAKQFADSKVDDLFAATPPVEALRAILSAVATGEGDRVLMVSDVSRAYFYADILENVYVALCPEDQTEPGDEYRCAKLIKEFIANND